MSTAFRPLAADVGCLSAEIFKEIRRCLSLRGGVVLQGVKWIWKTAGELAERLGCHEKTIRRHLKKLVAMGWLKREQHQKKWGMRAYHYTLGDDAPLRPVQSRQKGRSEADILSSSNNRSTTSKNSPPAKTARTASSQARSNEEKRPVELSTPAHWPKATSRQQTRLAIENLKNTIPLLKRSKPQGF